MGLVTFSYQTFLFMRAFYVVVCLVLLLSTRSSAQQCTGTPNAGIASASTYSICFGATVVLSATALSSDSGTVYQWQVNNTSLGGWTNLPAGGINVVSGSVNDSVVTISGQSEATQYRLVSTCVNSGQTNSSNTVSVDMNAPTLCYCVPSFTTGNATGVYINSVQVADIDTVSGPNGMNPDYWVSYVNSASQTTSLFKGQTYTLNVQVGSNPTDNIVGAWIDYNADGDFGDAGELMALASGLAGDSTVQMQFVVPNTSVTGEHILRIRTSTGLGMLDACVEYNLGETEDYKVNITFPPMPCSGTPQVATANGPAFVLPSDSFILSATGYSANSLDITLQWQVDPGCTNVWQNISGGTTPTVSVTQTVESCYRLIVTCLNSGQNSVSNTVQIQIGVAPPCYLAMSYNTIFAGSNFLQFNANTNGATGQFNWDFGDGFTSTTQNPYHNYLAGAANVCVTFTDTALGCTDTVCEYIVFDSLVTITGKVFLDLNQNGTYEFTDLEMENQQINIDGSYYTFTDSNGDYVAYLQADTHIVELVISPFVSSYVSITSANNGIDTVPSIAYGGYYPNRDFGIVIDSNYHDLGVYLSCSNPVPGTTKFAECYIFNAGMYADSATLIFHYDPQLQFDSSFSSTGFVLDTALHTATYTMNCQPGWWGNFVELAYYCPTSVPLGSTAMNSATVEIIGFTDANPLDNSYQCQSLTVGSYDPNDKSVTPAGVGANHAIHPDSISELTYTVRFQNTGTAPALNVLVIDTLDDSKVDVATLQLIHTSHNANVDIVEGHILRAYFNNIMLPDSFSNEPESHGQFTFKVNLHQGLSDGDVIANDAAIFFDFNEPIFTNSAFITLDESLSNHTIASLAPAMSIHPNPSSTTIYVHSPSRTEVDYTIANLVGQPVISGNTVSNGITTVDVSGLVDGLYFLKIGSTTRKFVVQH